MAKRGPDKYARTLFNMLFATLDDDVMIGYDWLMLDVLIVDLLPVGILKYGIGSLVRG